MRTFLIKGTLFSLPFVIWGLLILLIDPYNYFRPTSPLIPNEVKAATSYRLNYAIWKMVGYRRDGCPNILLGDSRVDELDAALISQVAGEPYCNLGLGGGTLAEGCGLFHFAAQQAQREHRPLRQVYLGVNFSLYNAAAASDRVADAVAVLDNPLLYACNRNVLEAAWKNVAVRYFGAAAAIEKPPMSRDEFWHYELTAIVHSTYSRYAYPQQSYGQLREIAAYCRAHQIQLAFLILPTHVDLQRRAADYGLSAAEERFRADLAGLALVYDFDYPSDLTTDREDYGDPFHARSRVTEIVIREVWGNPAERRYARVYGPGTASAPAYDGRR